MEHEILQLTNTQLNMNRQGEIEIQNGKSWKKWSVTL